MCVNTDQCQHEHSDACERKLLIGSSERENFSTVGKFILHSYYMLDFYVW
jgi:hypothetical protein